MVRMAHWAVVIPADLWATERLFQHDTLTVAGSAAAPDDEVLLIAGEAVVGLGRVTKEGGGELVIAYVRRAFEEPAPLGDLASLGGSAVAGAVIALDAETYRRHAARLGGDRDRQTWLVSVDLPIEAASPAEAVRLYWSYERELGPAELPAYVSPAGNELAMQAFVLGAEANQDPEEGEDD
jgi:hypothetical protein